MILKIIVTIAVVLPHSMFKQREYKKIIMQSAMNLDGSKFEEMFDLSPYLEMVQPIPAPIEVLGKICDHVRRYLPSVRSSLSPLFRLIAADWLVVQSYNVPHMKATFDSFRTRYSTFC